jgi:hypothetical protein
MTISRVPVLALTCCCLVGPARLACAQTDARSFEEIGRELRRGKTVAVTNDAGRTVKGRITDLSPASLTLLVNGMEEQFTEASVRQITERRRNTLSYGVSGLVTGALAGVFVGSLLQLESGSRGQVLGLSLLLFGGAGAGIGSAIGAATTHERVVYRAQGTTTIAIAPLTSPRGIGLGARVRF